MKETIRTFSGSVVGYYEIDGSGNKTILDFYGRVLGYYEKSRNVTTDFYRRTIAIGDVSGLFFKDQIKF